LQYFNVQYELFVVYECDLFSLFPGLVCGSWYILLGLIGLVIVVYPYSYLSGTKLKYW